MKPPAPASRLAVCSWSLQPDTPETLVSRLEAAGIPRVQLALKPLLDAPDIWSGAVKLLQSRGIEIASGMFGCVGEDYSTLESIRRTGGIAPDATWPENWKRIQAFSSLAARSGLKLVTFHAGFLPPKENEAEHARFGHRLAQISELFQARRISLALETGQETAAELAAFLRWLKSPNIGINFDPANLILYGKGNPIEAVRLVGRWIRQVHIKDARSTRVPGTWGEEVVVGTGEVDWRAFMAALNAAHFRGDFCIEREAGSQRVEDVRRAHDYIGQFLPQ